MNTWHYETADGRRGSVSEEQLRDLHASGTVDAQTLVWRDGMADWQPLGQAVPWARRGAGVSPGSDFNPLPAVENHLVKAILVTLFCCLPLGIVSIISAAQVNGKLETGDRAEAERLAARANRWANWAIGVGLAWMVLYLLLTVFVGLEEVATMY